MKVLLPSDVDSAQAEALLQDAMTEVDTPAESVSQVVVADDFAAAVAKVLGHPEKPNEKIDFGGKAIPESTPEGVRTTILLPAPSFRELLKEVPAVGSPALSKQSVMTRYAIRHEFGHAKDYQLRGVKGHAELDKTLPFRVADQEAHYLNVLLEEFAACAHSGGKLTQEEFNLIGNNEFQITQHFRRVARNNLLCFLDGGYEADNPASAFKYDTAGTYWWILISHAKVIAFTVVNPALTMPNPLWYQPTAPIKAIVAKLEELLKTQWASYPDLLAEVGSGIIGLWHRLMKADENISFEGADAEDAIRVQISPAVAAELQPVKVPAEVRV